MILAFDDYELDTDAPELTRAGVPVKADPLVLSLLAVLVRHAGKLVTKQQLVTHVWDGRAVSENVITVSMVRLRKVLGHKPGSREFVNNVHGRGYRFVRPVTRRAAPAEPPASSSTLGSSAPFVGREQVLAMLRDALHEARTGRGGLCVLAGEAGIGKTRAVEVLEREAQQAGVPVIWGHCREAGDTPPLWPFAELVRSACEQCEVDLASPRLAALVPELQRLLPELGPRDPSELEGAVPARKHALFDAITRVLTQAGAQPCVLVLDDLHRADTASLELLRYWIDELPRTKLLVLATMRTPGGATDDANQLAQITGHRNCRRLSLERLAESEVASYLEEVVPRPTAAQVRALFEKSCGNPYFMCELARELASGRVTDVARLELPLVARGLVQQRIAGLDRAALEVVSWAAVLGRRFDLALLQAVAQRSAGELMECLDRARTLALILPVERSNTQFVFDHELLREVLYDALPKAELRQCHVRVAQALERRMLAGEAIEKGELAYHCRAAIPDGDLRKTVDYCGQAARDAAKLFAYAEAARHLRHAREALDLIENASVRLRLSLVIWEALLARVCADPQAETLARSALQLARAQGNGAALANAAFLLDLHPGFPPFRGAREALEEALSLLPPNDEGTRAAVLSRLATIAPVAFDARKSSEYLERALALAPSTKFRLAGYNAKLAELHLCGGPGGEVREAAAMRALEALCEEHTVSLTLPPVLLEVHRAIRALQAGELARVSDALERARATSVRVGSREWLWHVERFGVIHRVNLGAREAAEKLRLLHRRAEREQVAGSALFVAFDRAVVLADAVAVRRSELRQAFAHEPDDPPSVWSMKLRGLAAAGMQHEARAALELIAPSRLAELPRDRDYLGTLGALARVVVALGALEYAEALVELLEPHPDAFAVGLSFSCEGSVLQLLAALTAGLGRPDQAREYLERGTARCEARGLHACAREGRQLLAAGK